MWMRRDGQNTSRAKGLAAAVAALSLAISGLGVSAPQSAAADDYAHGNNAARVSGYIKPCFGMLLDAQLRSCGTSRHYKSGGSRYGYHGLGAADAYVDCDKAHAGYVESVVRKLRPGGVLHLKARNRSCIASLDIQSSITIVGEGFGPDTLPALVAPDGQNCIRVSGRAERVILKNIYLSSPRGEGAACVEAANTELTIQNSEIRYQGDNAAVHLSGGRLNLTEGSHIIAKTRSSAVAVNNAALFAENSEIATTSSGLYGVLDGDSQIQGMTIQQLADWHGFQRGEGAVGLDVTLDSGNSILSMNDLKVLYFANGIVLNGDGEALLSHSLIARSDHGVSVSLDRVRLMENTIIANEIGIVVEKGEAFIGRNQIANVRTAGILAETYGEIRAVDNDIDPNGGGCPTLKWGNIEPAQRTCTPWYKGSEFDVPGDADDQYMFDQFWPGVGSTSAAITYSSTPLAAQDPTKP